MNSNLPLFSPLLSPVPRGTNTKQRPNMRRFLLEIRDDSVPPLKSSLASKQDVAEAENNTHDRAPFNCFLQSGACPADRPGQVLDDLCAFSYFRFIVYHFTACQSLSFISQCHYISARAQDTETDHVLLEEILGIQDYAGDSSFPTLQA